MKLECSNIERNEHMEEMPIPEGKPKSISISIDDTNLNKVQCPFLSGDNCTWPPNYPDLPAAYNKGRGRGKCTYKTTSITT